MGACSYVRYLRACTSCVPSSSSSGLHFTAALGSVECTKLLVPHTLLCLIGR